MGLMTLARLRTRRQYLIARAFRRRRQLSPVADRTASLPAQPILLFSTIRNERVRLPYFLTYYRRLGIDHFLIVDNGSDDGSREYLAEQPDVSVWTTQHSYKRSRFGMDWLMHLMRSHGHGRWCLTVDIDEFLVYPFCETRPLRALTDWLDSSETQSFGAMMLDMYPKGAMHEQPYREGQNPFEIAQYFDSGNYVISRNPMYRNLWIQGGPRARLFFADRPK
ncbi:MAG: glycosyltransferase family 2 protein, partial [Tabrizicola sp.]